MRRPIVDYSHGYNLARVADSGSHRFELARSTQYTTAGIASRPRFEWTPSGEVVRIDRTRAAPDAPDAGERIMSGGWIGRRIARKEDHRFLTGRGRYTDDLAEPGAVRAQMVRSPHPHARIFDVDV